jgi:hypothetical protein
MANVQTGGNYNTYRGEFNPISKKLDVNIVNYGNTPGQENLLNTFPFQETYGTFDATLEFVSSNPNGNECDYVLERFAF